MLRDHFDKKISVKKLIHQVGLEFSSQHSGSILPIMLKKKKFNCNVQHLFFFGIIDKMGLHFVVKRTQDMSKALQLLNNFIFIIPRLF